MSEHEDFLSMVVAGTAQIGVVEEGGGTAVLGRRVALTGEEGGDALAIEDAQFDGAGRHRFQAGRVEAAIRAQNAQAGAEPLFGMRPAGEHGADQAFGVRPDLAGPAAEPIRRPLGVTPVGAGHVVGVRAVLAAHVRRWWTPTRWPRWKISTVRAVIRTSTSARISACGTE